MFFTIQLLLLTVLSFENVYRFEITAPVGWALNTIK